MTAGVATGVPSTGPVATGGRGRAELFRALGVLAEAPGPTQVRLAQALDLPGRPSAEAHTAALVLGAHPYASVYLGPEGMLGGEAGDRVAGFWRAIGLAPPADADHLTPLLGLYAELVEEEAGPGPHAPAAGRARAVLLEEHLLSWVPVFAGKVAALGDPCYAAWATLLLDALVEEAAADREVRSAPAAVLPAALREAPAPGGTDGSAAELATSLLAPVRTGMVLAASDLAILARRLGLGLRIGERRYTLRALLEQDAAGLLGALAVEAAAWEARHRALGDSVGPSGPWWAARARAAAAWLERAAAEARAAAQPLCGEVPPTLGASAAARAVGAGAGAPGAGAVRPVLGAGAGEGLVHEG